MGFHRKGPAGGKPRPERAPRQWQAGTRPNEAFDRGDSRESPGLRATKVHNSGRRVDLPPRGRTYFGRFKEKLLSTSEKNSRGAHLLMHPRRREGSQEVQEPEELIGGRTYLAVRAQLQFSKSSRGRKLWRGQRRKNEGKSLKKFKRLETLEGATKEKRREESQKVQEPDKADTSETLRAGSSDPGYF